MLNGKKHYIEQNLKIAFQSGYANAASSLSKMTQVDADYSSLHAGFHNLDSNEFADQLPNHRGGACMLLTTEIFGDIAGKSYFLISEKEFDLLTHGIPDSKGSGVNLREEFTKELDNVLSASVITKLSNELNNKMYGDIPMLIGRVNNNMADIIYDDFNEQTQEVYVNSIQFSFANHPTMNPLFIWVVDCETLKPMELKAAY